MFYTATFRRTVETRQSDAEYIAASKDRYGVVRFHKTITSAHRYAGPYGEVVIVESQTPGSRSRYACNVCKDEKTISYGPSAVDGSFETVPCHRCS